MFDEFASGLDEHRNFNSGTEVLSGMNRLSRSGTAVSMDFDHECGSVFYSPFLPKSLRESMFEYKVLVLGRDRRESW